MNVNVSPAAIEADRLTKRYGEATAVDAISFQIAAGSITGLLGGNGAGKTTTIGMIMGWSRRLRARSACSATTWRATRHRVLHRMNFESPYVDMPHAADGAAEPDRVRRALRRRPSAESIARLAADLDPDRVSRSARGSFRPARRPASRSPRR
jgi:ABC-2 type transport system ATP-binding protein